MSNQMEEADCDTGNSSNRKPAATLPESFMCINLNNVAPMLFVIEELDPNVRSNDRGPHTVAKTITVEGRNGWCRAG